MDLFRWLEKALLVRSVVRSSLFGIQTPVVIVNIGDKLRPGRRALLGPITRSFVIRCLFSRESTIE